MKKPAGLLIILLTQSTLRMLLASRSVMMNRGFCCAWFLLLKKQTPYRTASFMIWQQKYRKMFLKMLLLNFN